MDCQEYVEVSVARDVSIHRFDVAGRLRRLGPHNTEGRTTRGAIRDTDIGRRLAVASRRDQRFAQRVIEQCVTVWAPWPHLVDRRLGDENPRNIDATADQRVANAVNVHAEPSEHLTSKPLDVEHAEQNVPRGHLWLLFFAREPTCAFESPLCPRGERQHFIVRRSSVGSQRFDHLVARTGETCAGRTKHVSRLTVIAR
jgi:hypothetical protein